MSGSSDEEISNGNRDGYQRGGSDGDDDEDEEEYRKKKNRGRVDFGFGKRLVLRQFTKAKNQIRRVRSRKALLSSSSSLTAASSRNVNVSSRGKVVIIHGNDTDSSSNTATRNGFGCKFCFSRPSVLENPDGSPSSDPNDPKFTHSMLKSLIENNDFYSKECNTLIESLID
ncbi:uncharacterized protein LOC127132508 isoform X1 [Lathyrus oleraceus]|uniref:Uncharacterized protein n=1 Tax=Pisum sativum TaxID=3888 RepID=A0A9D4XQ55_PEA|nr:uncharacterized protein LOC127132508 isoform X1 [Pisum sativum]KAI5424667.1 hypothetical protein KIW84_030744 [Pisum sativum]